MAERPSLEQIYNQTRLERPSLEQIYIGTRDGQVDDLKKGKNHLIATSRQIQQRKQEQFGENPRELNAGMGFRDPFAYAGGVSVAGKQPGMVLPYVGQMLGSMATSPAGPVAMAGGGMAGANAGEFVRQSMGRAMGLEYTPEGTIDRYKKVNQDAAIGELVGLGVPVVGKMAEKAYDYLSPMAKKAGINFVKRIVRPTGQKYLELSHDTNTGNMLKSDDLAESMLKHGIVRGNKEKMLNLTMEKAQKLNNQIDDIIFKYEDSKVSPKQIFIELDQVKSKYSKAGSPEDVARVNKLQANIAEAHELYVPVYKDIETGQFVIQKGSPSKLVSPKLNKEEIITKPKDVVQRNLKTGRFEKVTVRETDSPHGQFQGKVKYDVVRDKKTGRMKRGARKREILTDRAYIESPDDIVAMNIPSDKFKRQKIASVYPERAEVPSEQLYGQPKRVRTKVGNEYRNLTAKEAQDLKQGQYRHLESKRVGGGYDASTTSAEIEARQAIARGYRKAIEDAIPNENIGDINKSLGELLEAGRVIARQSNVADRNNMFGLVDSMLLGAAPVEPTTLSVLGLRKILGMDRARSGLARMLYQISQTNPEALQEIIKGSQVGRSAVATELFK